MDRSRNANNTHLRKDNKRKKKTQKESKSARGSCSASALALTLFLPAHPNQPIETLESAAGSRPPPALLLPAGGSRLRYVRPIAAGPRLLLPLLHGRTGVGGRDRKGRGPSAAAAAPLIPDPEAELPTPQPGRQRQEAATARAARRRRRQPEAGCRQYSKATDRHFVSAERRALLECRVPAYPAPSAPAAPASTLHSILLVTRGSKKMRELPFIVLVLVISLPCFSASDRQGDALYDMKQKLNVTGGQLSDWNQNQVNPCTWNSVICDNNNNVVQVSLAARGFTGVLSPRIGELQYLSVLSLAGNRITGTIPEEFGNLSSLTSLDLEDNLLFGEVPASLGNLSKLQLLILSQNNFNGPIPDSIAKISSLTDIRLAYDNLSGQIPGSLFQVARYNFSGNHLNCGPNFPHSCTSSVSYQSGSHSSKIGLILGTVGGILGLLIVGALFLFCNARRKSHLREVFVDVAGEDDRRIAFGQLKRFAWRELQIATDNFNERNVLGQGGFGKVYKGVLPDATKIAVKRLTDYESPGGEAAFLREVELISVAVHRNLLRLIGFCTTQTERLLVYPFMQNLSVAYRLREFKPGEPILDWPSRKRVAIGTARGLEYLHEHCNPKIIHRDVKAANVLLDEDFVPVVGDFGLAKLVDVQKTSVTTQVRGTMGHIAPEYLSTGKSSERTDVFGYGIMLLELVTGQRAIDFSRLEEEDDVLLLDHVKKLQRESELDSIVDNNLNQNYDGDDLEMIIQIALLCTQGSPEDRPSMSEVVRMLEGEGLAERWEEWQHVEVTRRQEYERMQRRFDWGEDSVYNQEAIELSAGR